MEGGVPKFKNRSHHPWPGTGHVIWPLNSSTYLFGSASLIICFQCFHSQVILNLVAYLGGKFWFLGVKIWERIFGFRPNLIISSFSEPEGHCQISWRLVEQMYTDRQTDRHITTDLIICPMLWYSNGTDKHLKQNSWAPINVFNQYRGLGKFRRFAYLKLSVAN